MISWKANAGDSWPRPPRSASAPSLRQPWPLQGEDKAKDDKKDEPEEVAAAEDLMREHGVLNRILLIYEEGLRRLRDKEEVPPDVFHKPAMLVRKFVEDYHEKLEENFIFPEFEKTQEAGRSGQGLAGAAPGRSQSDGRDPAQRRAGTVP